MPNLFWNSESKDYSLLLFDKQLHRTFTSRFDGCVIDYKETRRKSIYVKTNGFFVYFHHISVL